MAATVTMAHEWTTSERFGLTKCARCHIMQSEGNGDQDVCHGDEPVTMHMSGERQPLDLTEAGRTQCLECRDYVLTFIACPTTPSVCFCCCGHEHDHSDLEDLGDLDD